MINKKITPVKITFSNWVVREWSPTLFTTPRTKTNSLQGARANASHTLQPIQANNNNVWRSTGRARPIKQQAACTQTRCAYLYVCRSELESERKVSVRQTERERERKRELVWKSNWVANKVKYHPTTPVSGQLNHQEPGKMLSPPSMNSSQNHISMTSLWQTW